MAWTLYSYILKQLLKLLVISAGVLVVVLSFGASIKPISEGLLGPWDTIRVVIYFIPGMLMYALPFAAVFASTMVFFRMSADNEITACAASGISYRNLLMPVTLLGLFLMLGTFLLSNWVVPSFWERVERTVQLDVTRLIVNRISNRETVQFERDVLYADAASALPVDQMHTVNTSPQGPTLGTGHSALDALDVSPFRRLILDGVVAGRLQPDTGALRTYATAERAVVDLYRYAGRTYAKIKLSNAVAHDPERGGLAQWGTIEFPEQEIPSPFQQKPKFLSLDRLRDLDDQPDLDPGVSELRRALLGAMVNYQMRQRLMEQLSRANVVVLNGPQGDEYLLSAAQVEQTAAGLNLNSTADEPVLVRQRRRGLVIQRYEASHAELHITMDQVIAQPFIDLDLHELTVTNPDLPTEQASVGYVPLSQLRLDDTATAALSELSSQDLLAEADRIPSPKPRIDDSAIALQENINDLRRRIASQLHERSAMAVCSALATILGAVMSMLLRRQVPLAIFFWCFMPTVLTILAVSSAQNMARSADVPAQSGVLMTWAAVLALMLLCLGVYRRLARH